MPPASNGTAKTAKTPANTTPTPDLAQKKALQKFLSNTSALKVTKAVKKQLSPPETPKDTDNETTKDPEFRRLRILRTMIEFLQRTEAEWVDHTRALRHAERQHGVADCKFVRSNPRQFFESCCYMQFRKETDRIEISIKDLPDQLLVKLYDEEKKVATERRELLKQKRKAEREQAKAGANGEEGPARKKAKTSEPRGKSYVLKECCAIYARGVRSPDSSEPDELGVLNQGVTVRIDLSTISGNRVRMTYPIQAWAQMEELPIEADDVLVQLIEESEDEEDENPETSTEEPFTFLACQEVRLFRRRTGTPRYEIATLHKGTPMALDSSVSSNGWIRIVEPMAGWALAEKVKPPPLTAKEKEILAKANPPVISLIEEEDEPANTAETPAETSAETPAETSAEKKTDEEAEKKDGEKEAEKEKAKVVDTSKDTPMAEPEKDTTEKANVEEEKKDAPKKDAPKEVTMNGSTADHKENEKEGEEDAQAEEMETEASKQEEEVELDWTPVENLDAETITGMWSTGQKGGCFSFTQAEDGTVDGYLENKGTCSIEGKIDGPNMEFKQIWQKGSVHGTGVITCVKGIVRDGFRTLDLSFECKNKEGKSITGTNTLRKKPSCDISGVWFPEEMDQGTFTLAMSSGGDVTGYLDDPNNCKIKGRVSGHRFTFTQSWQTKPKAVDTSCDAFVDETGNKMTISYTYAVGGKSVTGTRTLKKITARALAGLWISGDRGGRFIFEAKKGNKFTGYLDSTGTCMIEGTVKAFTITFRQLWLKSSAHAGAIAEVTGKANLAFTKLDLEFACKKPDGTTLNGNSTLTKQTANQKTVAKQNSYDNECFHGVHRDFPANVFVRLEGMKLFPGQGGIGRFNMYSRMQKILILGEADFSFTLAMCRQFKRTYTTLIGSSYMLKWGEGKPPPTWNLDPRKRQFLNEQVRLLDPALDEIVERGGQCRFGVDARNLKETLNGADLTKWAKPFDPDTKFDRIIFPFPRASLSRFDPVQDSDLIRGTFRSCQENLTKRGELHLILHTSRQAIAQFDLWSIRELAEQENMVWRGSFPFDPKKMPRYQPKDVTGTPWRPFEPMINVFTPIGTEWRPEHLLSVVREDN